MINGDIKISVIIPVYNCENTIETCLNSILSQSVKEIEIIVIDDGSTDHTYELIRKMKDRDQRIKLVKQKNLGPSAARNKGIQLAKGKFINFVDADDVILDGMFDKLLSSQKEFETDMVISGIRKIINKNGKRKYINFSVDKIYYYSNERKIREHFFEILGMGINSPVGRIYRTSIIKKVGIYFNEELDMGEDLRFNIDYIDNIKDILFIPDIFYQYNTFNSKLTFKYRNNLFNTRKKSIQFLDDFLKNNKIERTIIHYLYIKLVYAVAMQEIENASGFRKRMDIIKKTMEEKEVKNAINAYLPRKVTENIMYLIVKIHSPILIDLIANIFVRIRRYGGLYIHRISV